MKGEMEMSESIAMKVTYIDPNERALFVAELPDGGYGVWAQKGKDAPRKLRSEGYINPAGYPTFADAQHALDNHVSYRRATGSAAGYALWEILVNGKHVTWEEYYKMHRHELPVPAELPPNAPVALANIEYRIAMHIQGAYENLLEIGHCLQEAKDSGLVPHGEWEGWVRRNTDMSERQAQRLMQAARSVTPGSVMERLPITKIQAILALPEPEREPMAEKAVDKGMSLRELQAEVKRLKGEAAVAEREKKRAEEGVEKVRTDAYARAQKDWSGQVQTLQARVAVLNTQIVAQQDAPVSGISPEAQEEIDRLKRELADAEEYAEQQAELRQQAQRDMLEHKTQEARGEVERPSSRLTADELAAAVRVFIGTVGVLPHMGAALAELSEPERQAYRDQLNIVDMWTEGAYSAIGSIFHVVDADAEEE